MEKISVYEDNVVNMYVQPYEGLGLLVHIDIKEWSLSVYKKTLQKFNEIIEELRSKKVDRLFAAIPPSDPKNEKFALMYGFEVSDNALKTEDMTLVYRIWTYDIK